MTKNKPVDEIEIDMSKSPERDFWDKFWHDKRGNLVVWQTPNIYLKIWFVAFVISELFHSPLIRKPFGWVAFIAILVWSALEMKGGVNNFRKALGLLVFLLAILLKF